MIKEWLDQICSKRTSHKKVYNKNREIVLSSLSHLQTDDSKRSSHGYFLEYARNKFRHEKIVKNILEWMPEFLLSPRELAETDSSDCYSVWQKTLERIKKRPVNIDISTLISEVLLHMLIRYDKRSQPISGMLYINSGKEIKEFNNIHIIRNLDTDELWMGSAFVSQEYSVDSITKDFASFLYSNLDPDIFDTSKSRVFEAKQDNHLLPHSINELLTPKATISGYADRYKFASLFIYNSAMLENGYTENYKQNLIDECEEIFKKFCQKIKELNDNEINRVSISVYLLPLESFD
ncbi:TPA: hypothetical protein PXQ99_004236, partial [Yersinia enterocolitica]|nr:hypothetical protein [Yersinia enterocolitica]